MLWHDYDPASFEQTTHSADEFELPDVCATTTTSCSAPDPPTALTLGARLNDIGGARGSFADAATTTAVEQ